MTCTVAPFDMLRTTLMNQPTDRQLYTGSVERHLCLSVSVSLSLSLSLFQISPSMLLKCFPVHYSGLVSFGSSFADAATKIFKEHGPMAFYRGFFPIWGRFAPQATLQLVIFDILRKLAGFEAI